MAKQQPTFDFKKPVATAAGNEVLVISFEAAEKLMGVILDKDREDGQFCSWDIRTGRRIGMGASESDHPQNLVNLPETEDDNT